MISSLLHAFTQHLYYRGNSPLIVFLLLVSCAISHQIIAQENGPLFTALVVNEEDEPLIGATINWKDSSIGAVTDIDGWFTLKRIDTIRAYILEISYVGYQDVEVEILPEEDRLKLLVQATTTLEDIVVETRNRANFTSTLNPLNIETIGAGELRRAACCNLSESFENNATVNVSFSDAVTGAKEIEMLGLKGTYTQMMLENRPSFNRLGRAYGLEYIPGTFISGIQISKGASSVKNGVQGITGQINTELIKPDVGPLLFVNIFGNYTGRMELNLQINHRLSKEWSTGLLLHGNYYNAEFDYNKDSFLDIPKKKQANAITRWMYKGDKIYFEINVHGIWDSRSGGQTNNLFEAVFDSSAARLYQVNNEIRRIGIYGKLGYFGFSNPAQSIALVFDANIHQHQAVFGNRQYKGLQKRIYANIIYQTTFINKYHNISSGLSYDLIDFKEQFSDINYDRTEHNGSIYAEYDFIQKFNPDLENSFGLMVGIRGDLIHLQQFTKLYPSPRINLKYNFNSDMILRVSGGRGVRNPNLFIENIKYMPSYRNFVVRETILPEVAWNYGLNFTWNFKISPKLGGNLSLDLYRTDFENQLVADIDSDPNYTSIQFYNLQGQSYANSFLLSYTQDVFKGLEARIAYKFNDVWMTMGTVLHEVPLMPRHRGLIHLNYTTPKKDWEFNITLNVIGPQRLPHLHPPYEQDLPTYRLASEYAPSYANLNAHISKFFKGGWEIYLGGENLTNYTQKQPILGFQDPFDQSTTIDYANFDASSIYASVFGVQVYAGVKYTFKVKDRFKVSTFCNSESIATPNTNKRTIIDYDTQERILIQSSLQCSMCELNVKNVLNPSKGIKSVEIDVERQYIDIIYKPAETNPAAIRSIIAQIGYDADSVQANAVAYNNLADCCKKGVSKPNKSNDYLLRSLSIKSSVQCGMCRKSIQKRLYNLNGVENVSINLQNKIIRVQWVASKQTEKSIKKTISQLGYDADTIAAKPSIYNRLPSCCKKPQDR